MAWRREGPPAVRPEWAGRGHPRRQRPPIELRLVPGLADEKVRLHRGGVRPDRHPAAARDRQVRRPAGDDDRRPHAAAALRPAAAPGCSKSWRTSPRIGSRSSTDRLAPDQHARGAGLHRRRRGAAPPPRGQPTAHDLSRMLPAGSQRTARASTSTAPTSSRTAGSSSASSSRTSWPASPGATRDLPGGRRHRLDHAVPRRPDDRRPAPHGGSSRETRRRRVRHMAPSSRSTSA